jgi:TetR/AcrR family transcriptional regulator, regulator of cefoperazone and chloramphenicol sensitivity
MDEPRHANGPVTREKLIEAAGEIFAEKGLHGALIRDITQRAGANIASVNYHFHDKFELYALVLRQAHEGIVVAMQRPLSADTPEGRVRQLLSAMLTTALDPSRPKWHTLLLSRELLQPTPALDLLHDVVQSPARRLWEAIEEIRPELSEQQIMLAVSGVVAQCLFHVHHGHIARRMFPTVPEPDLETLVEHVVDFSLAALRGLHATPAPDRQRRRAGPRGTAVRPSTGARKRKSPRNAG